MSDITTNYFQPPFDDSNKMLLDEVKRLSDELDRSTQLIYSIRDLNCKLQTVLEHEPQTLEDALETFDFTYTYIGMINGLTNKVQSLPKLI